MSGLDGKPFAIPKQLVWQAWRQVKANGGAAGADGVTIEMFEKDLKDNLYKVWNRMSSGTYFPPPVRAVEIPKASGGTRILGVPSVADRVAQTVAAMALEPRTEAIFHEDSYGYRPRKGALDAVTACRQRCWAKSWVIDLDIRKFFDSVPWDLVIKAVQANVTHEQRWIVLYVKRWLAAPIMMPDGRVAERDRGTPQGSAVSPVLANLFMHYAFDKWLKREFPAVEFERYADDAVVHCATEQQARRVLVALEERMADVGLQLHPDKTKIVYCKDRNRRRSDCADTSFTFLGYTFRARQAPARQGSGAMFSAFLPAVSKDALKRMSEEVHSWRIHLRSGTELADIASWINPVVRGWMTYYGRFYRTALNGLLQRINSYLVRWAKRKYKRLRSFKKVRRWWEGLTARQPACSPTGPGRPTSGTACRWDERSEGRLSRSVLWEPGGEIPPGHPAGLARVGVRLMEPYHAGGGKPGLRRERAMARSARPVVLLAVMAVLAGCTGPGFDKAGGTQARQPLVLTLANFIGESVELDGFAGEVRRLSAGTMRIDIRSRWRLGQVDSENGLIGDVSAGNADLGVVGSRAWDSAGVNSFRALSAPLLINSYALQDRVLRSPMTGQMLRGLRPLGLAGIGVLPGPLSKPLGMARPLLRPSDYAGLRIGVQQSRVADATMRALGATPVWFPATRAMTGLDGIEQQISSIQGYLYDKAGRYLTANVSLWPRPLVLFANGKTWAALTPAQRRILSQAVTGDQAAETDVVRGSERGDTAILCRRGLLRFLTASPADLAALRRAVRPVFHQLERDPQTGRYIRQIEAMGTGVAAEPAPGCGHAARPGGTAGPLDGVWQFTTTAADLRAAGVSQGDIVPENYGTYTFVIDRGRFAFTQENGQACTWAYGSFTVMGDRLEQLFTDGGGIAPDGAANKPGELFTFRWSLYRSMLTLYPVKGAVSPNPSVGKPWPRISTTPSPRFLSKRCPPPAGALPP